MGEEITQKFLNKRGGLDGSYHLVVLAEVDARVNPSTERQLQLKRKRDKTLYICFNETFLSK